jgi:TPR repeat protein
MRPDADWVLIIRPTERCASAREWLLALEESTAPLQAATPPPDPDDRSSPLRWSEPPVAAQPAAAAPSPDDAVSRRPLEETAPATTPASPPPAPSATPTSTARRHPWAVGLNALLLLGSSAGGYVFWQQQHPTDVSPSTVPASVASEDPERCPMTTQSIDAALTQARQFAQQGDYGKTLPCYHWATDQGNTEAQYHLGLLYEQGLGVVSNPQEAIRWYRQAADQGNADAQTHLGVLYETGEGLAQDYAQAAQWYRQAAAQGNAWAQNNLGWLYETGQGVAANGAEALKWYRKAAAQGETRAKNNLKRLGK